MSRRGLLIIGCIVLCVAAAATVALVSFRAEPAARADSLKPGPVPVTSPLPPEGLVLKSGVIFKPLAETQLQRTDGKAVMTEEQAISAGRAIDTADLPVTAVLASVTWPGGYIGDLSGTSKSPSREFKDIPMWVLTFSLPAPVNVSMGGGLTQNTPPIMASQHTMLLDAYTGEFIRGFFSP